MIADIRIGKLNSGPCTPNLSRLNRLRLIVGSRGQNRDSVTWALIVNSLKAHSYKGIQQNEMYTYNR